MRSFWSWLILKDRDGDRGISNIVDRWIVLHIFVGVAAGLCFDVDPRDLATKIALPGAAILVGLSFAWAGRSASLFQDKGFSEFIILDGAPIEGYIYSFQLAILVVLSFIGVVAVIYLGGIFPSTNYADIDSMINRSIIVSCGSISVRECWGTILFVNKLTIQYYAVREAEITRT